MILISALIILGEIAFFFDLYLFIEHFFNLKIFTTKKALLFSKAFGCFMGAFIYSFSKAAKIFFKTSRSLPFIFNKSLAFPLSLNNFLRFPLEVLRYFGVSPFTE
jgi:hypothetical protein